MFHAEDHHKFRFKGMNPSHLSHGAGLSPCGNMSQVILSECRLLAFVDLSTHCKSAVVPFSFIFSVFLFLFIDLVGNAGPVRSMSVSVSDFSKLLKSPHQHSKVSWHLEGKIKLHTKILR